MMAHYLQDAQKGRTVKLQNGQSCSTTNIERYSILIKSFLTTVGSDVLRSLITESAENAKCAIEEVFYQHQTSIIYALQHRMRNKLQLVYPPNDEELDLKQWNCRLLCLVIRATDCLGEKLSDDVSFIERTYIKYSKDEITLLRRSASSYGNQLQPKKEWTRVCGSVQRLAEHVRDTRLLTSVRNFIYKVEMGTKLMDARIETHLSLTKMISELAASHSDRMSTKDSVYTAPLGELSKFKQQYDMVSKPSFSESRSPQCLSRTMVKDGEPTRPLSSRDRDLSDKPAKSTSVILLSTVCTGANLQGSEQIKRSNSSELIAKHNQNTYSPPKRHRPFSNTSLSSIPGRSVKLVTPKMSLSDPNENMNDKTVVDLKSSEHRALENMTHCHNICTDTDNEIVPTNTSIDIPVKRQIKMEPTEFRNAGTMLSSRTTNEIHHNLTNSTSSGPRSFDVAQSISRTMPEPWKNGDYFPRETNQLLRNTVPLHKRNSAKERGSGVVQIYTKSLKIPPKEKTHTDKGDKKQPTVVKPDLRMTIAEKQDMALKLIQQPAFSSLVAYTMKYQRSVQKKKVLSANAKSLENGDKIEEQEKDETQLDNDQTENDKAKYINEDKDSTDESNKKLLEIENKDVIEKIQTRRKSTFGRLKDLFKNVLLPNKQGSESISSHNSSGTLSNTQTPADSFSAKSSNKSGRFEQLLSEISPTKTKVSATQSDGYENFTTGTETSKSDTVETEPTRDNKMDTEIATDNKTDATTKGIKIDAATEISNIMDSKTENGKYINIMTIHTEKYNKMNAQTKGDNQIMTETAKGNEIDNETANVPDAKMDQLNSISDVNKTTSNKPKEGEIKGGSIKELKNNTRVKFRPDFESLDEPSLRHGKDSFNYKRKRRQSLPLLTFQKSGEDSPEENISLTRRRASITASPLSEVTNLQKPKTESDKMDHIQKKHNGALEAARELKIVAMEENKENKTNVKFSEVISQIEGNSKIDIKEETYASNNKLSTYENGTHGDKEIVKAKNLAHPRKSIAVSQLSSSMRVGSKLNRPVIARSNSESELNITTVNGHINNSRPNINDLRHSNDIQITQGSIVKNRKKSVIINSPNAIAQPNDRTDVQLISLTKNMKTESKSKQLPITQKSFMASSFKERPLEHKKEFVRAKSESEFKMSALNEANKNDDSGFIKNQDKKKELEQKENSKPDHKAYMSQLKGSHQNNDSEFIRNQDNKRELEKKENSQQDQNSLLAGAVLYEDDIEKTNDSSKQHINETQSISDKSQEIIIQNQIQTERAKLESSGKNEVTFTTAVPFTLDDKSTKDNDEPDEDPEAEMKKIANDVIVHHQVHKAAREFMEKDKEFVNKFFTFLHKYQATKEFLKTEQYSPFKTLKLSTGIKASLSFIHAFTFRHVNVFDRDQCNHVVEKILKRIECEDAKRSRKAEKEIIDRINIEKSANNKDDVITNSEKSKNKGKAKRGTNQDASKQLKDKQENQRLDSFLKDLQDLERCHCWKCRQKDLAMTIAVNWRNHGISELLLKYGVQFKIEHLLPAVRANDGESVKEIVASLRKKYAWDSSHEEARMALILARFHSMHDIVHFLEKEGVQDERVVQCACFA